MFEKPNRSKLEKSVESSQVSSSEPTLKSLVELEDSSNPDRKVLAEIEVIEGGAASPELVTAAENLERSSFPEKMQSGRETLEEIIEEPGSIHIFLKDKQTGNYFAYTLAVPASSELGALQPWDPQFIAEEGSLYVESTAVKLEYRKMGSYGVLLERLIQEARRRGIKKLVRHARQKTLSPILQARYGLKPIRTIDNWQGWWESFDYFEQSL